MHESSSVLTPGSAAKSSCAGVQYIIGLARVQLAEAILKGDYERTGHKQRLISPMRQTHGVGPGVC